MVPESGGRCRWCLCGEAAHCGTVDYFGLGSAPGGVRRVRQDVAGSQRASPGSVGRAGALVEPLAVGLHAVSAARFVVFHTLREFVQSASALGAGEIGADHLVAGAVGFDRFDETFSNLAGGELRGKYLLRP